MENVGEAARSFGRAVKAQRQARGWTQAQLAEPLARLTGASYHQSTIAKLESAGRPTSIEEAAALAEIFGLELADLFRQTGEAERVAAAMKVIKQRSRVIELETQVIMSAGALERLSSHLQMAYNVYRIMSEDAGSVPDPPNPEVPNIQIDWD